MHNYAEQDTINIVRAGVNLSTLFDIVQVLYSQSSPPIIYGKISLAIRIRKCRILCPANTSHPLHHVPQNSHSARTQHLPHASPTPPPFPPALPPSPSSKTVAPIPKLHNLPPPPPRRIASFAKQDSPATSHAHRKPLWAFQVRTSTGKIFFQILTVMLTLLICKCTAEAQGRLDPNIGDRRLEVGEEVK